MDASPVAGVLGGCAGLAVRYAVAPPMSVNRSPLSSVVAPKISLPRSA
jgi:hypothetical protein